MMSQHLLKTAGVATTVTPGNASQPTAWWLDLSPATEDELLIGVSVAVFGFPALVICLICALRLRVYYIDKQNSKLGFHTTVEESSLLATEENNCRGGHVNIKLSTINEALKEEEDDGESACEDGHSDGFNRCYNHNEEFPRGKNTIVRFDVDSNQVDKVPL